MNGDPAAKGTRKFPAESLASVQDRLCAPGEPFEMTEQVIRGIPTRTWRNAPPSLRSVVESSRTFGDRVATIYGDDRISFDAQFRATVTLARWLTTMGVSQGDRVAIAMRNLPEWPVAFFAITAIGAIAVPLNSWWTGPELAFALQNSGAGLLIADAERVERVAPERAALAQLKTILVVQDRARPVADLATADRGSADVIGAPSSWPELPPGEFPEVAIMPDDDATILYTSGTTGQPKGAIGSHRNMTSVIMAAAYIGTRAALRRGDPPPAPRHRTALIAIPLFHVTGCAGGLVTATAAGNTNVYMHHWDPLEAMRLIEQERVTSTGGVPTIAWQLTEHPDRARFDLSSLESIGYGGAPSAPKLVERISAAGLVPSNGWGMTETTAVVSSNIAEDYILRPTSCGPPLPVSDFRIAREDGVAIVGIGEVGELWARGPQVVRGYWNNAEASAATFVDGWVRTGDLAYLDAEGFCYIVDRLKDVVIRGGENIYAAEVENALQAHPSVDDVALIGLPHPSLGEEPAAVIHLNESATVTAPELQDWLATRLAPFKIPKKIAFTGERLPRNPAGKILKRELPGQFFGESA